jgi:hypothetical protein
MNSIAARALLIELICFSRSMKRDRRLQSRRSPRSSSALVPAAEKEYASILNKSWSRPNIVQIAGDSNPRTARNWDFSGDYFDSGALFTNKSANALSSSIGSRLCCACLLLHNLHLRDGFCGCFRLSNNPTTKTVAPKTKIKTKAIPSIQIARAPCESTQCATVSHILFILHESNRAAQYCSPVHAHRKESRLMAKKMSKLEAFKGRSKGQNKRRKREALQQAVEGRWTKSTTV